MDDYISRSKLVSEFVDIDNIIPNFGFDIDEIKKVINRFPSADVIPIRRGTWSKEMVLVEDAFGDKHCGYQCSYCKAVLNKTNYCGNCGAIMNGEIINAKN